VEYSYYIMYVSITVRVQSIDMEIWYIPLDYMDCYTSFRAI